MVLFFGAFTVILFAGCVHFVWDKPLNFENLAVFVMPAVLGMWTWLSWLHDRVIDYRNGKPTAKWIVDLLKDHGEPGPAKAELPSNVYSIQKYLADAEASEREAREANIPDHAKMRAKTPPGLG